MVKAKILVVEDDLKTVIFIVDQLEHFGYEVIVARNGEEALEKVHELTPHLIVLDIMMPRIDGLEVCNRLKSDITTQHIPILMLTAKGQVEDEIRGFDTGTNEYMSKPYDKKRFKARIEYLLKNSRPFPYIEKDMIFTLSCTPGSRIRIRINGDLELTVTGTRSLDLDVNAYAHQVDTDFNRNWRFDSKRLGSQLYKEIFTIDATVLTNYGRALGQVKNNDKLHLRFESSRNLLRVPLEFLFEGVDPNVDYLVLDHPLARRITGVRTTKRLLSPSWFNNLFAQDQKLKILLIASNTMPPIAGVDEEISALSGSLGEFFADRRISVEIKTIPTEDATYETVRKELERCKYHIVHYAGHGTYNSHSPEKSYLSFWEGRYLQDGTKDMPVAELQLLLRDSKTQFFYLSGCFGTKTGDSSQLLDNDFLGIADGLIHAGIPSVLGYRWPVSDSGAKEMALAFYRSLAEQGQIDTALLYARRELAARNRDDITWLSPILIMQG